MQRHIGDTKKPTPADTGTGDTTNADKLKAEEDRLVSVVNRKAEGARLAELSAAMTDRLRELAVNLTVLQRSVEAANQAMREFSQCTKELNARNR